MTPWTLVVGVALVDFVWQGTVIALAAALLLRLLRRGTPRVRYVVACAALAMMLMAPFATAFAVPGPPRAESIIAGASAMPATVRPRSTLDIGREPARHSPVSRVAWPSAPRLLQEFVIVWLAGVVLLFGRLCVGWMRVRRLHAESFAMPLSHWAAAGERIAARLSLARVVRFVDSALVHTPVVVGWLRPVVVLPVAALSQLTPEQVEAIIAHELAHIRRHDFVINVLQVVAEILLFYHPGVWWLSARIRVEREQCCDDVAVELCGNPAEYAEALTHLASWHAAPALAVGATSGPLLDRVQRILRLEPRRSQRRSVATFALAALLVVAVVFLAGARTILAARVAGDDDAVWVARLAELHRLVPDFHGHLVPGPLDVNRMMHFNLFPDIVPFPGEDPRDTRAWAVTVEYPGGEMSVKGFAARGLIRDAYDLGGEAVIDVPSWMDDESVSLVARTPSASPDTPAVLAAIRVALDAQIHVRLRREVRDYPVYALVLANPDGRLGPNLRPATPEDCVTPDMLRQSVRNGARVAQGQRMPICGVDNSLTGPTAQGATIPEIARAIQRPWLDRPVVDRTGLEGTFDARLQLGLVPLSVIASVHPGARPVLESMGVRSMQDALAEQLGLALQDSTAPYDVFVVDAQPPHTQ